MNGWSGPTIEEKLKTSAPTSGFDILRISLAFGIIYWHTTVICYGIAAETPYWTGQWRPMIMFLVPSFFALSGFLVAGSLDRNDIKTFAYYRLIRIYPALIAEVIISAFVLGVLFTTLPLREYFTAPEFMVYLSNALGMISFLLPGVFESNPVRTVNGPLWTVPIELQCYVILVVLFAFGVLSRARLFAIALVAAAMSYTLFLLSQGRVAPYDHAPQALLVIAAFVAGVIFYRLRDEIRLSLPVFLFSLVAGWILLLFEATEYLAIVPVTYVTVYIGMANPQIGFLKQIANYSYGVYLYGFPIQQAVYAALPGCRTPMANFAVSAALTLAVAALSWHLLELRALQNRNRILAELTAVLNRWEKLFSKSALAALSPGSGKVDSAVFPVQNLPK